MIIRSYRRKIIIPGTFLKAFRPLKPDFRTLPAANTPPLAAKIFILGTKTGLTGWTSNNHCNRVLLIRKQV